MQPFESINYPITPHLLHFIVAAEFDYLRLVVITEHLAGAVDIELASASSSLPALSCELCYYQDGLCL